jgi:hypothetical protein
LSTSETGLSNPNKPAAVPISGSKTSLAILTVTALTAAHASTGSNATLALGLSYALVSATGILLVQHAVSLAQSSRSNGNSVIYSANGFLAQPEETERESSGNNSSDILRDVCAAAGLVMLVASIAIESWRFGGVYQEKRSVIGNWDTHNDYLGFAATIAILLMHMLMYHCLLLMVSPCYYAACRSCLSSSAERSFLH